MSILNIPLLDLKAQHQPIRQKLLDAIEKVVDSQAFIMGPEVKTLEKRIAEYSQTKFGIGVSSGTDALLIALMALDIGHGDEVIVPDYSFFATAGVVSRVGAKPVFVDIDPVTYNIDPQKIEEAVTPRTKAVIVVHLFGQCADMEPILKIARTKNLKVIEDAAQSLGAEYKNKKRAGSMGDMGCFSFFPSKNLGCFGDGGMVVTNDEPLAEKLSILRVHGSKPKYYHKLVGGNFRLDTIQAAILNVKLDHLDEWTRGRQKNAATYRRLFEEASLSGQNVGLPAAIYQASGTSHPHIYNQFTLRTSRQNELREFLMKEGVGCEVYYPIPFHQQECFANLHCATEAYPSSLKASREALSIPIYPELTEENMQKVVEAIARFYQK